MSAADDGKALAEAMEAFHGHLREAQQLIEQTPGLTLEERADGYAYLMGLMVNIVQSTMANVDTMHPQFRRGQDTFSKFGLDNPDNLYGGAHIDDTGEYRIKGTRGTATDFMFQIIAGNPGDGSLAKIVSQLDLDRIQFNPDGGYEIIVSRNPQPGNWLESGPGASLIVLRQCFGDDWPHQRKGEILIERIGAEGTPAPTPTPDQIARRISNAGRLLAAHVRYWIDFNDKMVGPTPVNAIAKPWRTVGGIAGQFISAGKYNLADDQALVLTFEPVNVSYANILLADLWWFITYDYRDRQTSYALPGQAWRSPDGKYRYVVSKQDPGVPNWLDTCGRPRGTIFLRWQGVTGAEPQQPAAQMVKVADVPGQFKGEPVITPDERRRRIAARSEAISRRYGI
ncbi:MAG TPA: hypothetical protein VGH29_04650 [Candidatus Binataceae bacterium]